MSADGTEHGGSCGCPLMKLGNRRVFLVALSILLIGFVSLLMTMRSKDANWLPPSIHRALMNEVREGETPQARERAQALLANTLARVVIRIDQNGQMILGADPYTIDRFDAALEQAKASGKEVCVVVQSDPRPGMELVESVAAICLKRGVKNVSFNVDGGGWTHVGLNADAVQSQGK